MIRSTALSPALRALRAFITAALVAAGCSPGPTGSPSAASQPAGSGAAATAGVSVAAPAIADVLTYKGGMTRLGVHPGPGPTAEPGIMWQVDVPSGLVAAPLVVDETVVAISEDGTIRGIDAVTGAQAWTTTLPSGVEVTPTIAAGTLYVVTVDGVLRTVSLADRKPGWTAVGFLPDTQITIAGELVLAGAPGELVALGAKDGTERWRGDAPGSGRAAADTDAVYVSGTGSGDMHALNIADGTSRWMLETTSETALTPAIDDGQVIVAARDIAGGNNVVYALGPDGSERWHSTGPDIIGSVSVTDDRVYLSTDDPKTGITALDRGNGNVLWRRSLGGAIVGLLAAADGTLYLPTSDDGVVAVDGETGEVRWRAATETPVRAQLAVSGGLIFVGSKLQDGSGRVVALAAPDDPRLGGAGSSAPPVSTAPAGALSVALRILSADEVEGQSLFLSTAVGPDGTMYVADMANSRILIRSADGRIESWGEYGSEPGKFNFGVVTRNDSSAGVAIAPDGKLIAVGDGGNHRVQLFDDQRRLLTSIGRLGREDRQFVNPCCVAVDAQHRVWVVDAAREDVQVFSETGEHLLTFAEPGHGDGQLSRPAQLFVDDATNRVYIADFSNRRIAVFGTDGTFIRSIGGDLGGGIRLSEVNCVIVDRAGRLFVLDTTSSIFVLDADGKAIAVIDSTEPDLGLSEAGSFALDADGRMYYGDFRADGAGRLVIGQLEAPLWPPG